MKPTREEIHEELAKWHPTKRLSKIFRESKAGGARVCEVKNSDGNVIDAYEYEGAYYDMSGIRLESEWVEYNDIIKNKWFRRIIGILFVACVLVPAFMDGVKS